MSSGPVLKIGLEVRHEFARIGAIDDAVVEAKGEALDGPNGDGVLTILVGEDEGFLVEPADSEDGGLWLVDDRGTELLAEDAGVGDGEGSAGDFVRGELLGPGAFGEIDDGAGDA